MPDESVMRLSDAFREEIRQNLRMRRQSDGADAGKADAKLEEEVEAILKKASPDIEVTVRMININYGHSRKILAACEALNEYSWLVEQVRTNMDIGMELEESVKTSSYVTGIHEVSKVDENTLLVAGNKAALFDAKTKKFTALPYFSGSTSLKSVNCLASSKECWYTDATTPEGDFDWSTHTIRHTDSALNGTEQPSIKVDDINMYKVRVYHW